MIIRMALAAGLVAASISLPAAADPNATPGIDRRQDNQERRIDRGVESGRLTEREANRLNHRQNRIQSDVDQAKSDGTVTRAERRQLHRTLNRSSGAIAHQKHDAQRN